MSSEPLETIEVMPSVESTIKPSSALLLSIDGMTCSSCSGTIESLLRGMEGVLYCQVTLSTGVANITYDTSIVSAIDIKDSIESIGFDVDILSNLPVEEPSSEPSKKDSDVYLGKKVLDLSVEFDITSQAGRPDSFDIEQYIRSISGVQHVVSKENTGCLLAVTVTVDENIVSIRGIVEAIQENYPVIVAPQSNSSSITQAEHMLAQQARETANNRRQFLYAALLTLPVFIIGMFLKDDKRLSSEIIPGMSARVFIMFLLTTPVQFCMGWRFHQKTILTILSCGRMSIGMDFMVSAGTFASYIFAFIGLVEGLLAGTGCSKDSDSEYFETSAVLITVIILGKYMESSTRGATASAIHNLTTKKVTSAQLVMGFDEIKQSNRSSLLHTKQERTLSVSLLGRGDLIRLTTGSIVAADGIFVSSKEALLESIRDNSVDVFQRSKVSLKSLFSSISRLSTSCIGIDESMLTGESLAVRKRDGDVIYGGTMVVEGSGYLLVTATGNESVLGHIVNSVQEAQNSRPAIQEVADRIAKAFVPVVTAISIITFITWYVAVSSGYVPKEWMTVDDLPIECKGKTIFASDNILFSFTFGLAVWVSACPCAFGLATPTVVLVATGVAAKHGVLIRRGAALQNAADVKVVAFDKTGTLTTGNLSVSDFYVFAIQSDGSSVLEESSVTASSQLLLLDGSKVTWRILFQYLLILEQSSNHPLSKCIILFCQEKLSLSKTSLEKFSDPDSISYVAGKGIKAKFGKHNVLLGSIELLNDEKITLDESSVVLNLAEGLRNGGKVALFFSVNQQVCAVLGLSDTIRPESVQVISELHRLGIETHMITGDEEITARTIGAAVGIPQKNIHSKAKPETKERLVSEMQYSNRVVCFVGDGTNDSPALARANVGVVMSSGTDIAIEVGDILLCKNNLLSLLTALEVARKSLRRIKINYFWALAYNIVLIPIAAGALYPKYQFALKPMYAGAAMAFSSVSIVLSSLLLKFYQNRFSYEVRSNTISPLLEDIASCSCPVSTSTEHAARNQQSNLRSSLTDFVESFQRISGHIYSKVVEEADVEQGLPDDSLHVAGAAEANRKQRSRGRVEALTYSGGCGCGKVNCMCGSKCNCGVSSRKTMKV